MTAPVHHLVSERAVLGFIFLTPEAIDDVAESLAVSDFAKDQHQAVFGAMLALARVRTPIDTVTIHDQLVSTGDLDRAGGVLGISDLDLATPFSASVKNYVAAVRDASLRRRLVSAAMQIVTDARDPEKPIADTLQQAEVNISGVSESGVTTAELRPIAACVSATFAELEILYNRQTDVTGVPSGFDELDKMTTGFQKGDLFVLAGRPAAGKTAMAMGMAANISITSRLPVVVFEQEMSEGSLTRRLFASEGRVDGQRIRTGRFLESDWPKLAKAADRLFKAKLFVDDAAGLTIQHARTQCRRIRRKHGPLGLIVVDYIQLMRGTGNEGSREQEISGFSRGLKALAREMECTVVALSQLNRSLEKREDKRPMMSDLRESGAIEQDADLIGFVYRDEVYNKESPDKGKAEIIIAKQRNGPTGTVRVAFHDSETRFDNLAADGNVKGWG